ncbi:hypothetical protein ES708_24887 [subsurface metagenome]
MSFMQIKVVQVGDFQLVPPRRFEGFGQLRNLAVIKIQSHHYVVRFWVFRLFFDGKDLTGIIEVYYAIALWISHVVTEDHGAFIQAYSIGKHFRQAVTVKDVVPQNQAYRLFGDKIFTDNERFSDSPRCLLLLVEKRKAQMMSVSKQGLKAGKILGSRNDQYLPDTCEHEHGERVVNHWFIVNREKLFTCDLGSRIQASSVSPS